MCVVSVLCLELGLKTLSFRDPNYNVFAWGEQATNSSPEKGESFTIGFFVVSRLNKINSIFYFGYFFFIIFLDRKY